MVWVFAIGLGDQSLIPGQIIPKTQKMVLDASLSNTQHYKALIKCKWSNPGNGVAVFSTPRCYSYWKGSLQVTLSHSRPTYLLLLSLLLSSLLYPTLSTTVYVFQHNFSCFSSQVFRCPGYDTKLNLMMRLGRVWSTPLLLLLLVPLWLIEVVPVRVTSMGQTDLF